MLRQASYFRAKTIFLLSSSTVGGRGLFPKLETTEAVQAHTLWPLLQQQNAAGLQRPSLTYPRSSPNQDYSLILGAALDLRKQSPEPETLCSPRPHCGQGRRAEVCFPRGQVARAELRGLSLQGQTATVGNISSSGKVLTTDTCCYFLLSTNEYVF